ncbi:MAG TPA: DUF4279 domain-containing protein [Longimicrobiaceae bacterium]|nr:DUF4279 domain-containing protein [Longimicrobiaceae bacterium]
MLRAATAALRIMGPGLDLDAISAVLGPPSHTHRAGDRAKSGAVYRHDLWSLESPLGREEVPGAHLGWLAERLRPHLDYLRGLKDGAALDLFCSITSDDQGGFALPADALALPGELGIPIEVSLNLFRRDDEV